MAAIQFRTVVYVADEANTSERPGGRPAVVPSPALLAALPEAVNEAYSHDGRAFTAKTVEVVCVRGARDDGKRPVEVIVTGAYPKS